MSPKGTKRLTLVLPERTVSRLNELQELTDASSATEVIRNALLVYEVVAEAAARGSKLIERKSTGEMDLLPITLDVEIIETPDDGEPDVKTQAA